MQQWFQVAWLPETPVTMVARTSSWAKGAFIFNTLTRVTAFNHRSVDILYNYVVLAI